MTNSPVPPEIRALEQPDPALWKYYILAAIFTGPGILIALPYNYFRYHTLRYRFDEEGIHMRVGILFRREVNLTYARIQDIHLRSNLIQRWLGLANIQVQTASGSSGPELMIEGFKQFEAIRDFLYTRMRGYQSTSASRAAASTTNGPTQTPALLPASEVEALEVLRNIRDELRGAREALEKKSRATSLPGQPGPTIHV